MKNKAVFLDRDGVLNKELGKHVCRIEDFELLNDNFDSLKSFQDKGYLLIVISNQSGIAKELYTRYEVEKMHHFMANTLKKLDIELTEIYYCPHHPDHGKCICRKPDSLLLEKALARFQIDPAQSYFIGDKERDIAAGEKAGVKGILVEANSPLSRISNQII